MRYTPRQHKLVLEILEDRHVPGVCFDFAPPAPDSPVLKSSLRQNALQTSIDSLMDILITGLDSFATVPVKSQSVEPRRTEPRGVDAVSPLSFSLTELNEVLNSSFNSTLASQRPDKDHTLGMGSNNLSDMGHVSEERSAVKEIDSRSVNIQEAQAYVALSNSDALYSILSGSALKSGKKPDEPTTNWVGTEYGNIRIDCTTNPASGGNPEGILGNIAKLNPGWLSNVNWSDNDNDGWIPETNRIYTAEPNATYTPDKDDTTITNGDPDLRKFKVYVSAHNNMSGHDWSFKLTFGSKVAVYESNTKAGVVPNGKIFSTGELTTEDLFTKSKTLWLEGKTASTAFRDVELHVDYVGGNIPMLCTFDTVNVTVFGVTQTGILSGPQQDDNQARFKDPAITTRASHDENGQISWDLPNYLNEPPEGYGSYWCKYFHDCIEIQGTVSPPRDANPSQYYGWTNDGNYPPPNPLPAPLVEFAYYQQVFGTNYAKRVSDPTWIQSWPPQGNPWEWVDDVAPPEAQSVRPSLTSHIYMIDGPGIGSRARTVDYVQNYLNFRSSTYVAIYGEGFMCSNWYIWHSVMFLKPKDSDYLTRAPNTQAKTFQDFGPGWFSIPTDPDPTDPLTW